MLLRFSMQLIAAALTVFATTAVYAQDYPNKPIRILCGGAGGGSDFTARQIAQGISAALGQPLIVDNRSGVVSAEAVSKSPPDGYTLLVSGGTLWTFPLIAKAPYDALRDFSYVIMTDRAVLIITVHPSLPVKSIKELIALAKARPGELNYGSGPTGGSSHLAAELFKSMTGTNIVRVPYKGGGPGLIGLLAGEVQLTIDGAPLVPHIKAGKLRGLAVTSAEPSALVPGLPTVAASGVPGYEATVMSGVLAPAKTPVAIINRLNQEITRFLSLPEVKERFLNTGVEVVASTPDQFAAAVKADMTMLGKVVRDAGIKAE